MDGPCPQIEFLEWEIPAIQNMISFSPGSWVVGYLPSLSVCREAGRVGIVFGALSKVGPKDQWFGWQNDGPTYSQGSHIIGGQF